MSDEPRELDDQQLEPGAEQREKDHFPEDDKPAPLRLRDLREIRENPDHPRYTEAQEVTRKFVEPLKSHLPKIDMSQYTKRVFDSTRPESVSIGPLAAENLFSNFAQPGRSPVVDQSWIDEVAEGIAASRGEEIQRQVDTLEFMRAVAEGIEAQNRKLDEAAEVSSLAEEASKKRDRRNARIAGWTLCATVIGIIVAIGISILAKS